MRMYELQTGVVVYMYNLLPNEGSTHITVHRQNLRQQLKRFLYTIHLYTIIDTISGG